MSYLFRTWITSNLYFSFIISELLWYLGKNKLVFFRLTFPWIWIQTSSSPRLTSVYGIRPLFCYMTRVSDDADLLFVIFFFFFWRGIFLYWKENYIYIIGYCGDVFLVRVLLSNWRQCWYSTISIATGALLGD